MKCLSPISDSSRTPVTSRRLRGVVTRCAVLALAVTAGCFSSADDAVEPEGEAKELKAKDEPQMSEAPESELAATAKKLYQSNMFTVARDSLQSLHERYPTGAYAQFSQLKVADSYFFNREYVMAAKQYEDFIKEYPGSPDLPYVKLQAARSNNLSTRGTGRDRQPLEKALQLYDELVERYPHSEFGRLAEIERAPVVKQLAEYDQMIIDFYEKRENTAAVEARRKVFNERWGARLRALDRDFPKESALHHSTPQSPTTPSAAAVQLANTDKPTAAMEDKVTIDPPHRSVVTRVACLRGENPYVVLEVQGLPTQLQKSMAVAEYKPDHGVVTITGFNLEATQRTVNCFSSGDLRFLESGDVEITTPSTLLVATVDNPPRILITSGDRPAAAS